MKDDLLAKIQSTLAGRMTLASFELWLVGQIQDALDSGDDFLIELVNEADADLIQLDEGLLTETQVRARLQEYAGRIVPIVTTVRANLGTEEAETKSNSLTVSFPDLVWLDRSNLVRNLQGHSSYDNPVYANVKPMDTDDVSLEVDSHYHVYAAGPAREVNLRGQINSTGSAGRYMDERHSMAAR